MSYASASLGALLASNQQRNRSWYSRVLVGSYFLNDENFYNHFEGASFDPGYERPPLEDDYWGIRRSFWLATNNIYKTAARYHDLKTKILKEYQQEYQLGDFVR